MALDPNETRSNSYLAQPGARVRRAVNTNINNAAWTLITPTVALFDPFGMRAGALLIIRVPGRYIFGASLRWAANNVGDRGLEIRVAGNPLARSLHPAATAGTLTTSQAVTAFWDCNANDQISMWVYQSSGAGLNALAVSESSMAFWAQRVG